MNAVIRVENVSKHFFVQRERYRSFQDVFVHLTRPPPTEEFWALREVSLQVQPGETVGVIGDNGSGKSTLLKLVTRIMEPTSGRIAVTGKVAALLELGAGFHPDLSGRDNVYLNCSLMGVRRKEVDARFDEIVAFAELADFIDVPVRRYSSGMYLRLAFATAITIPGAVLLVDEVLAVGDVAFQEKCIARLHEIRRSGRAILIVSHTLEILPTLCDRVVWLNHGHVAYEGAPAEAIARYHAAIRERDGGTVATSNGRIGPDGSDQENAVVPEQVRPVVTHVRLHNDDGQEQHVYEPFEPLWVEIGYADRGDAECLFGATVTIRRDDGLEVHRTRSLTHGAWYPTSVGEGTIAVRYDALVLAPGHYTVDVGLTLADNPRQGILSGRSSCPLIVRSSAYCDHGIVALSCHWSGTVVDAQRSER